jgi:hypothetical protein
MSSSFVEFERQRSVVRCRLLEEIRRRRLPGTGGWGHCGTQFGTEPTSLALIALHWSPLGSTVTSEELAPLIARQLPNGLWPAVGDAAAGVNFWATALAVNTLMTLGATPETFRASLDALVHCRPLEASWLVRLKFRLSDRQVRFDPKKYGWPWGPDTVSWVVPTSMALITLGRAKRQGLIRGSELEKRLRLGAAMLLDRACPEGGWNAGNAVVYGVPLRPHIDATALALAALRFHYHLPIVRNSLTWMLNRIDCPSAYSLAWVILAAAAYKEVRSDVSPVLDMARDRLAKLVEDPGAVEDTSTVALAALALGPENTNNPFEVAV